MCKRTILLGFLIEKITGISNSRNGRQILLVVVLPAIAIATFSLVLLSSQVLKTEAVQSQHTQIAGAMTAKEMFQKGLATDLIDGKPASNMIRMMRGQTISVPITMNHLSHTNQTTITLSNFHNTLRNFAPSAQGNLTDREFDQVIAKNSVVKGEIPVNDYVSFPSLPLSLPPNASAPLLLTISIPSNYPDEMLGKVVTVNAAYNIEPTTSVQIRAIAPSVDIVVTQ
jgi:hypothetical protein